jgi:hypothetical protein
MSRQRRRTTHRPIAQLSLAEEVSMSFVTTQPEILVTTAGTLAALGSALNAHNAAAAAPTTGVVAPAADEVSAQTAASLAGHAQKYQAVSAQAAAIHRQFVATLTSNANFYADAEAANVIVASLGSV